MNFYYNKIKADNEKIKIDYDKIVDENNKLKNGKILIINTLENGDLIMKCNNYQIDKIINKINNK